MKKAISFLLAIVMVLSLVPMTAFAAGTVTIGVGSSDQTVSAGGTVSLPVTVESNSGISSAKMKVVFDSNIFELTSFSTGTISGDTVNTDVSKSMIAWMKAEATDSTKTGILCYINLKVKEGVTATGEQTISVTYYSDEDDFLDAESDNVAATFNAGKVTLETGSSGGDSADGYTVEVANSSSDLVAVNGSVALNVNVNNTFNSAKITLSYETSYLTFVNGTVASNQTMGDKDQAVSITGENGVITIIDYGTAFASGAAYTLNFTAAAATTGSEVKVTYAGLSTAEEAAVEDLTEATSLGTVSVPVGYTVTVPDATDDYTFTASASTVVPGGSVGITVNNPYYDYELSATGGTLTTTESGWTVSNVTGNVVVSVTSATPKTFDVTVKTVDKDGNAIEGIDDVVTTNGATYGTPYSYTLPNNEEIVGGVGTQYTLKSITVGGNDATYTTNDRTSTIDGANVTGDIVITICKEDLDPNAFTVSMVGETSAGTLEATQVDKNGAAKLTLSNKEAGYTYTVTATMGSSSVTPSQSGDVYTVSDVTGNVVFTISKTLDTTSLDVTEYVQLDGKTMWLVKINGLTDTTNKTYTYKASEDATAENFFWSSKYNAYCYLIITDTSNEITAETVKADVTSKLSLVGTAAVAINYNGNVNLTTNNGTAVIDVNDAQLVWNMYSAVYSDFTDNVTVQKFLEADMDFNGELSTNDAAEVVKLIG